MELMKSPVAVDSHKAQPSTPPPSNNSLHNKRKLSRSLASFVTPSPTHPQPSLSSSQVASSFQQLQQAIPYLPYNYFLSPLQNQQHHIYNTTNYEQHYHHQLRHSMSAYPNPQPFPNTASAKDLYNRKRQRRQAAAAVVASPFSFNSNNPNSNNNAMGRKSTAQPRPKLNVPPRGIGPIVDPNDNDVLCGRGGRINSHAGNVQFREIIQSRKKEYLAPTTKKLEKAHIAAAIVNDIRAMDPPGRFLKEDRDTGLWFDIGDAKAIKKTGQALREDAPDIRPDLEGDESSGDDKDGYSLKKNEKKSPKATSPQAKQSPKQLPTTQVWPQGGNNANNNNPQMQAHEYQAQMAMPPPNNYPPQQQSQVQMPQQQHPPPHGFETRSIPIPAPNMRQVQQNFYTLPNQLYSGANSVTSRVRSASKQAMAALSQAGPTVRSSAHPPDDIAFGRPYHPPETHTVLSSDNTMSTISGLSENLSSNMSGGGFRPSALMNMSIRSSGVANRDSLQISNLQGFSRTSGGRGYNSGGNESSMGFSGLSGSSLQRSLSLGSIMEGDNWKAIMEAGDEILDEAAVKSIFSGSSAKHSLNSGGRFGHRDSSAMSIGGLSMDLASNASSTQWLAAAGLGGSPNNMGDDHTAMSVMSANLDALDLASLDRYG